MKHKIVDFGFDDLTNLLQTSVFWWTLKLFKILIGKNETNLHILRWILRIAYLKNRYMIIFYGIVMPCPWNNKKLKLAGVVWQQKKTSRINFKNCLKRFNCFGLMYCLTVLYQTDGKIKLWKQQRNAKK